MAKTMWKFKTRNFTIRWTSEKDVLDTNYMDKALADECRQKVRSGEWQCFVSDVIVTCNTTGIALGEASLGNSIYANPADFRDHFGMTAGNYGSYFADMVRGAIKEARERFPAHQASLAKDVRKKQKVLGVKLKSKTTTAVDA